MEHFKLNGRKFSMPTGWHDVSYNDGINIIQNELNEIESFALLTGIDEKEFSNIEDYKTITAFVQAFPFLKKRIDPRSAQVPLSMKIGEHQLISPAIIYNDTTDLGKMNAGQIIDMKNVYMDRLESFKGDQEDWTPSEMEMWLTMPDLVAIYVQKLIDGEYDYQKALKLVDQVKAEMSFKDVINMGYFFFMRLNACLNGFKNSYPIVTRMVWKLKRDLLNLTRGLARTRH